MIETLFAGLNGFTVIPGKKKYYASEYENNCEIKVGPQDSLELTYENGFSSDFAETNVIKSDPASIISCDGFGGWTYNILIPKGFVLDFIGQRNGYKDIRGGKESQIILSMIEPMYAIYKQEGNSDRLVDFIPWLIKQVNGYSARSFKSIYIKSYTLPSVRKIQYLNQAQTITANTDQASQFGISHTKYGLRTNLSFVNKSEKFYRLAIDVKTNPTTFAANKFRTNLTINDFDIHAIRIDNFYIVHPKVEDNNKPYIEKNFNATTSNASNKILKTDHLLFNNSILYFSQIRVGGVPPSESEPLKEATNYYVINATANDFQVSLTPGGSPINIGGDYDVIVVYQSSLPLTISNYPEFKVQFGSSKLYQVPTLSNFTKREDVNKIDRNAALKDSLTKFKNQNTLQIAQTGNIYYTQGMIPLSASGYAYTGNTIYWFQNNIVNSRPQYLSSGLFDSEKTGDGNIIQAGTVSTYFRLTNSAKNFQNETLNVVYYNISAKSGIFKSINETGFFKNNSGDATYKSGVYTKFYQDIQKYLSDNYNNLTDEVYAKTSTHPNFYIYSEAAKQREGAYGGINPFYLNSGFYNILPANFYLFAHTAPLDNTTYIAKITGISLKPSDTFKPNAASITSLGITTNTRWILNPITKVYDKVN
jgi:hypothetical protein